MQTLPPIRFTDAYKLAWVNFAKCTGRSRRSEFWFFGLANFMVFFILGIIAGFIGEVGMALSGIYLLAICIPAISLSVRRLHDTGKSGCFIFLGLIPLIGEIILLYFYCLDSEERQNEYGPSPKYILPNSQVAPIYNNYPEVNTFNSPQPYAPQPYPSQPAYIPPGIPPTQGAY